MCVKFFYALILISGVICATTSTKSSCCFITSNMFLYASGLSSLVSSHTLAVIHFIVSLKSSKFNAFFAAFLHNILHAQWLDEHNESSHHFHLTINDQSLIFQGITHIIHFSACVAHFLCIHNQSFSSAWL